jgi:hypothetical protein
VLSELERTSEPLAHHLVQAIPDITIRPPPRHTDHLGPYILTRLRLLVPLIRIFPHRPPPPQQRAPPPHNSNRTFRTHVRSDAAHEVSSNQCSILSMRRMPRKQLHPRPHDAPHVRNVHRRRRICLSAPQPRLLSLRKTRARWWWRRYILMRALRWRPTPREPLQWFQWARRFHRLLRRAHTRAARCG